jgi:sensor histidine kinase regulating citrate/malate metabolism
MAALLLGKYNRARELGIDLHIGGECGSEDWPGGSDDQAVITIVGNLVDNAIEAVKDMEEPRRRVTVRVTPRGGELVIAVRDRGPGIPPEAVGRIFDDGFTTKGPARGIGLGIVKRRVEALGGSISVATEGATEFQVRLPCRSAVRS